MATFRGQLDPLKLPLRNPRQTANPLNNGASKSSHKEESWRSLLLQSTMLKFKNSQPQRNPYIQNRLFTIRTQHTGCVRSRCPMIMKEPRLLISQRGMLMCRGRSPGCLSYMKRLRCECSNIKYQLSNQQALCATVGQFLAGMAGG